MAESALVSHIQHEHVSKSIEEYVNTLGPLMTRKETHQCLICGEVINCTEKQVHEHMAQHRVSMEDYDEKYLSITRAVSQHSEEKQLHVGNNAEKLQKSGDSPMGASLGTTVLPLLKNVRKPSIATMSNMNKNHLDTSDIPEKLQKSKEETSEKAKMNEAFDKCEYFCRLCPEQFYTSKPLIQHLRSHEGVLIKSSLNGLEGYMIKKDYGPLCTKSVKHTCLICNAEIFHTTPMIADHLKLRHQDSYTLEEYYNIYMDHLGNYNLKY